MLKAEIEKLKKIPAPIPPKLIEPPLVIPTDSKFVLPPKKLKVPYEKLLPAE